MTIHEDILKTQKAFLNGVWPKVSEAIGGGKIVPVEATGDREFLDQYAGIDHWHIINGKHDVIRGIASRCQWRYKHVFKSFTIRIGNKAVDKTELAKRLYAFENKEKGFIRPHLFIQSWFEPPKGSYDKFILSGVARMDDILTIIRDGKEGVDWKKQVTRSEWGQNDANEFAVIDFNTVKKSGFQFQYIESKEAA